MNVRTKLKYDLYLLITLCICSCEFGMEKENSPNFSNSTHASTFSKLLDDSLKKQEYVIDYEKPTSKINDEEAINQVILGKWSSYQWSHINTLIIYEEFNRAKDLLNVAISRTKDEKKKNEIRLKLECIEIVKSGGYDNANHSYSKRFIITRKGDKYGLILSQDKHLLFEPSFQSITDGFQGRFVSIEDNGKYGLLDSLGTLFLPIEYEDIDLEECSPLIGVKRNGKYGIYDANCNLIIPHRFTSVMGLWDDGLIIIEENNKFGLMDTVGAILYEPEFDEILNGVENGAIYVEVNGKEKKIPIER